MENLFNFNPHIDRSKVTFSLYESLSEIIDPKYTGISFTNIEEEEIPVVSFEEIERGD